MNESRRVAQYKESSKSEDALLHVGEIVQTHIELSEVKAQKGGMILEMKIADYRMLQCRVS